MIITVNPSAENLEYVTKPNAWTPIGYGLEVLIPPDVEEGDRWDIELVGYATPTRLTYTNIGNSIAVTSTSELISLISSNLVFSYNRTEATFNYPDKPSKCVLDHKSNNLICFFNHLFLTIGKTLWWTDLDNIWNWYPTPSSEADFRDIEWEPYDITAITKLNDVLFVHFPTCIYSCEYVGKPTIVRILNRISGSGAINSRCATSTKTALFFLGLDNFYLWSPDQGLQPIGNEVWAKFTSSTTDFQSVWCYIDHKYSEICWVSGRYTWAYNYLENHWQKYDSNSAISHSTVPWYPSNTGLTANPVQPIGFENVWSDGVQVFREQRVDGSDDLSGCLVYSNPYLETDEISYGDNHFHKKVDLVFVDCDYDYPWHGVEVGVSVNDYVTEKVRWVKVGVLDKFKRGSLQQVDFKARQGRTIKFRFELVSNLDVSLNEKGLDLWNGSLHCNDRSQRFMGRQYRRWDGRLLCDDEQPKLNRFEFHSWGQRVDIPQTLIGPDK